MSLDIGINFRNSSGYVTDGAGETYCLAESYPTTRGGITFGWDATASQDSRDRDSGVDRRLAGINFTPTYLAYFQVDLPNTGTYDLHLAVGDAGGANTVNWDMIDGSTVFASTSGMTSAGNRWKDATDVERTNVTWPTSEVAVTRAFGSTTFKLRFNSNAGGNNVIAHLRLVEQVASGNRRRRVICGA